MQVGWWELKISDDREETESAKSAFDKWCHIPMSKNGNPPTFCSNWPNESCQDQTNKQAH